MHVCARRVFQFLFCVPVFALLAAPRVATAAPESFPAFRARLVQFFRQSTYVCIDLPHHAVVAVDTQQEGKTAWETMIRELERAPEGWAMVGSAEAVHLRCSGPTPSGLALQSPRALLYLGGLVGFVGDPMSLRVEAAFGKAINSLAAISEERDRRRMAYSEPSQPPAVSPEQAREIARVLATAAGLDRGAELAGIGMGTWADGRHQYDVAFSARGDTIRVELDGADGSILKAERRPVPGATGSPAATPISKELATAIGTGIATVMGITPSNARLSSATLESAATGARQWVLQWKPVGGGSGKAKVVLDAATGRFVSAGESLTRVSPAGPPIPPPKPPPPPGIRAEILAMPGMTEPNQPVHISAEQAKRIAAAFAAPLNLPFGEGVTARWFDPNYNYGSPPLWTVKFYDFSSFDIDSDTGKVLSFASFSAWEAERARAATEGTPITRDQAVALAEQGIGPIGLPPDAVLKEVLRQDGAWKAVWKRVTKDGIPFEDDYAAAFIGMTTGKVISASVRWTSRLPQDMKVEITREQAEQLARRFADEKKLSAPGPVKLAELTIVRPSGYWTTKQLTGLRYDTPTRLAWVVRLGEDENGGGYKEFWVDAKDGRVIGGTQTRCGGPPGSGSSANGGVLGTLRTHFILASALGLLVLIGVAFALRTRRAAPSKLAK